MIDSEFRASDKSPDELSDGVGILGFDVIHGAGFFNLVRRTGEDFLEAVFDEFFGVFDFDEIPQEG